MLYLFNIYYISFNIVVNIGYTVYYELRSQRACRTCKYILRESDMRQLRMRFFGFHAIRIADYLYYLYYSKSFSIRRCRK